MVCPSNMEGDKTEKEKGCKLWSAGSGRIGVGERAPSKLGLPRLTSKAQARMGLASSNILQENEPDP